MALSGLHLTASIGGVTIQRCPRCVVATDRRSILSRARIDAPDPGGELERMLAHGQPVTISMGYRGTDAVTFMGTVDGWEPATGSNRHQLTVHAAGPELPLVATRIKAMFLDESVDWLARRVLDISGLPLGAINAPDAVIPRTTFSDVPLWRAVEQLAHSCRRAHGHDMSAHALWLDESGAINWGPHDDPQPAVPMVATAAGLIRHLPTVTALGRHRVETFLLPVMRAGRRFKLRVARRGVDEEYRALRVEHVVEPKRARTIISYGREYAHA